MNGIATLFNQTQETHTASIGFRWCFQENRISHCAKNNSWKTHLNLIQGYAHRVYTHPNTHTHCLGERDILLVWMCGYVFLCVSIFVYAMWLCARVDCIVHTYTRFPHPQGLQKQAFVVFVLRTRIKGLSTIETTIEIETELTRGASDLIKTHNNHTHTQSVWLILVFIFTFIFCSTLCTITNCAQNKTKHTHNHHGQTIEFVGARRRQLLHSQVLRCVPGLWECRSDRNGTRDLRRGGTSSARIGRRSRRDPVL